MAHVVAKSLPSLRKSVQDNAGVIVNDKGEMKGSAIQASNYGGLVLSLWVETPQIV